MARSCGRTTPSVVHRPVRHRRSRGRAGGAAHVLDAGGCARGTVAAVVPPDRLHAEVRGPGAGAVTRFAITVRARRADRELLLTTDSPVNVRQLCAAVGLPGRCFVNGREVSPDAWLSDAGAGDGAVISDEPAWPRVPVAAPESLALLVTSGPAAGASVSLPAAGQVVGREAPLRLGDEEVSARHF